MIVSNNVKKHVIFSESSLAEGLKKISENKSRLVYVVSAQGVLLGSLSDGDVRRWILAQDAIDLSVMVENIMNPDCLHRGVNTPAKELEGLFVSGVESVPLVDELGRIQKIAFKVPAVFSVGGKEIGRGSGSFIIAEIGNNHQGSVELAMRLVDCAVDAGVDCVKFQMRNMADLYKNNGDSNDITADLGAQYTMDLLERFQLSNDELYQVFDYCKQKEIIPLCTPWDIKSLRELESYDMAAYKVASADFTNFELLEAVALTGKPFFCSTGMTSEKEILQTVAFLDSLGANYVLLHCNSTYPTPYKDVNLLYLKRLQGITGKMVGYSGHERGIEIPVASVALGACVIEKHITLDRALEGADHKVSLLPMELADMVRMIRNVEEGLGSESKSRELSQGELINRENLAKSLVARNAIEVGEVITRDMVEVKSPGQGLQPNRIVELVGKRALRKIDSGGFFFDSDIDGVSKKRESYCFGRPYGVPVRYHDYFSITKGVKLDFVEFHLSYKDMDVDINEIFLEEQALGFAVHSPELFQGDHILDLCSSDEKYRERSIRELQKVVCITRKLKKYFTNTEKPVIVLNAGGWDRSGFIEPAQKNYKYELISEALAELDLSGVQMAIQTMPPFPWHFGGQSFHNLFVNPHEIVRFCKSNPEIKMCLDISHSMMACNYYGWELTNFVHLVAPYVVHLHIVDSKGVDGEGVEVGKGDVDFESLFCQLNELCHGVQFIPEVWQGHKNDGEGFWRAFNFLEQVCKS